MIRSEEKQDMTLEQYLVKLVKRWKLMVICIVLLGVAAYVGSGLMTPIYQSTALVQIAIQSNINQSDYNSLLASDQLVETEAELAVSDPVLREVASHYPGLSIEQLSKDVTTVSKTNTQLFAINVQDRKRYRCDVDQTANSVVSARRHAGTAKYAARRPANATAN
jgi:capsular polysaccharide biosynthesis protein